MASTYDAILLAGSRKAGDPLAAARGVAFKCLIPILDVPMLLRVVRSLAGSSSIGRIVLVGDASLLDVSPELGALAEAGRLITVSAETSPSRSVAAALERLGSWPVLVTTADHPLLTPELVERFLGDARTSGADVAAGLTPAQAILARFPGNKRTYWKFKDGRFSGANLFALQTPKAANAVLFWRRVEEERKRPWRIARLFGLRHLVAYLTGRLSLDAAFGRASSVVGARLAPVSLPVAEAAIDVDKLEDLLLVEKILRERAHA
ncbi:nucleotidyltransferase family protein [Arboricoccus pini]|nr:nucleotidyltransferase family protein [Arboricoccus pini]